MAMAGKGCVALAVDRRFGLEGQLVSQDAKRVLKVCRELRGDSTIQLPINGMSCSPFSPVEQPAACTLVACAFDGRVWHIIEWPVDRSCFRLYPSGMCGRLRGFVTTDIVARSFLRELDCS